MQLQERFIRIARQFGGKLAFNDRFSDRKVTYGKSLVVSLLFARKFRRFKDSFIGIMVPTSAGCAFSVLGALMAGKKPVMINYSTGAANNARYAQKKCGFHTIITSRALLEKINCPIVDGMVFLEDIASQITIRDKLRAALTARMPVGLLLRYVHTGSDSETVAVLFTSGSEKDPKAVELTHKNIISNIEAFSSMVNLNDKDVMLANLPYFHVFGLTVNMWAPLYHGMTIVSYANPLDFQKICQIVREERPTVMAATPSFWWGYLKKSEKGDFDSLRILMSGADKCPQALRDGFMQKHSIELLEGYGTTETSPVISVNTPEHNKPGSVGRPLPGVEVKIENYETGEECKPGEVGRILVRGDLVMKGYYDDIEETAMRIRHGWYDTGDMGYIDDDGYLWHSGRLKRFIKVGGEMVSLVKVEEELERLLPQGVACCVVEFADETKGARVVAAVTDKVDERKILKQLSGHLPNIAIPKHFVVINELPKMGSGKIDFRKVTDLVKEHLKVR
jgi:acyl-[acyl-carrier-protein]-phospholipid O-acyltransferase/long-chain-fatty-acid--[acyl-carrier-protein] ligase